MCFASVLHIKRNKKFVVKALSTAGELLAEAKKKKAQLREPLSETEIIAAFLGLRTACRGDCGKEQDESGNTDNFVRFSQKILFCTCIPDFYNYIKLVNDN